MALVVTPGAANANSYASLVEFAAYASTRPGVPSWYATATDAQKEAALIMACRMLDARVDWTGAAVDDIQNLTWPRSGMLNRNGFSIGTTVIPQALKDAQCELALQMGTTGTGLADNDALKQGITSVRAGSVAVSFKEIDESSLESADIAARKSEFEMAWLTLPDTVRQLLVPSWFTEHTISRALIFEAM